MNITGTAIDWIEHISEAMDDLEARPAGSSEPQYSVSREVSVSRDRGFFVYHVSEDQLGPGSSFGNASTWAETKGSGEMLSLFSIKAGLRVMGGMSLSYMLPFMALAGSSTGEEPAREVFTKATPSAIGTTHLHPAFQQHELVIGDGLHLLETFFVPRTGMDDPTQAVQTTQLWNRTPHPTELTVVACLDVRGETPMDMEAEFSKTHNALLAWNQSEPDWVRVLGASQEATAYWATTDEEEAYSPRRPLPCKADETGNLICALQFNLLLLPGQRHKLRIVVSFSKSGKRDALRIYHAGLKDELLKRTTAYYSHVLDTSVVEVPDDMLAHAVQWAKACLVRPLACYPAGEAATNDPSHSSSLVGRDTAWYVHGCDSALPLASCSMLKMLAKYQRDDGLIREYVNGLTERTEDFGFNINDNTPLFLIAVVHHVKATAHWDCLRDLYDPAIRAGERILASRNDKGLVECTSQGIGPKAICGWRNVLQNERLMGAVTEVNSECYAALRALADLAELSGDRDRADGYRKEALELREAINKHLLNPNNGLYVRNIDTDGSVFTQTTSDLVFPLICGVSDEDATHTIVARLAEQDFMTEAGIRVLPTGNPHYDPSFESGCLGGVWPGVTWWYSMSASETDPSLLASSLRRAYYHYVSDPRTYNTVPGQFSEWSDGQTLVNRGMRLSPWDSPRFLWAAIEGLAGVSLGVHDLSLVPHLPPDWLWLRAKNVPYRDAKLGFFITRQRDGMHVYTANSFRTDLQQHHYEQEISDGLQTVTTGISAAAFRTEEEIVICLGNSHVEPTMGPLLAHHALRSDRKYHVSHLSSHQESWSDFATVEGPRLMRVAVPVQGRGYALYKFRECR